MSGENMKRLAHLAGEYAKAYIMQTDAPEGVQGAHELLALSAFADAETRGIHLLRDDSGKADAEIK